MREYCNRCGEKMLPQDEEKVFNVGYSRLSDGIWQEIRLCIDCQKDLRNEFYMRRLTNEVNADE